MPKDFGVHQKIKNLTERIDALEEVVFQLSKRVDKKKPRGDSKPRSILGLGNDRP
jgi:hypothetical protein